MIPGDTDSLRSRDALPKHDALTPPPPFLQEAKRDFARLLRDASEGLPVAGRSPVWEAGRPTVVHAAQKPRGFITYERRQDGVARCHNQSLAVAGCRLLRQ